MSKPNELLGFGGMISGRLLDLKGEKVVEEGTANIGARHRSAYRLAGALAGSVAVVISQDGGRALGVPERRPCHVLGARVNRPRRSRV
jgi:hypothetical protein